MKTVNVKKYEFISFQGKNHCLIKIDRFHSNKDLSNAKFKFERFGEKYAVQIKKNGNKEIFALDFGKKEDILSSTKSILILESSIKDGDINYIAERREKEIA